MRKLLIVLAALLAACHTHVHDTDVPENARKWAEELGMTVRDVTCVSCANGSYWADCVVDTGKPEQPSKKLILTCNVTAKKCFLPNETWNSQHPVK